MANPKIQEILGLMQKNLECAICLELLRNPVVTSCRHHFCRFCITEFLMTKRYVPCPLCKQPVSKRSLQDKAELNNIVTSIRSLISAFQEDAGCIFSPPNGPQSFFPCTPEIITKKPRLRKTKAKESRSGRLSDQPQKEDICSLLDDDKDTTTVSCSLSPAELMKDKQGLVDISSSAIGTNGCPTLSECKTQLSTETSNSNTDKILQYFNEGSFGLTSNVQTVDENISDRFNSCQLRQKGARGTKVIDSKEKSSDAAVETRNLTDVPEASVLSCLTAPDILEKENIGSVTTESKQKKRGKDHTGLADYSNSAQVKESSQNSSDQSVSSTQQFLQPRPPLTRTYSRHVSRVSSSFKVRNWIASLPPNPDESVKENKKVVTGLVNDTLSQNNNEEANDNHDSCTEMQSKGHRRTRNSLKKDLADSCITKKVSRNMQKYSPTDNKDKESFGFTCKDSVQSKHDDVQKKALPCESEKYTDGESSIVDRVPVNATKPDALPENPVDEPVTVTPPRSRGIFKKRESSAQLTAEAIPASDDPYLFEVGHTPLLKKKGRPRSKENKSMTKPVANLRRRSEKCINLSTAAFDSTQSAENKRAQIQEKVLDLKVGEHINDFPLQNLSRSIVTQEIAESPISVPDLFLPPTEEGGSNKVMEHTARRKRRKVAEKNEVQSGGENRSQMKEQIEKLASWIDRADEHALVFSTQEACDSMESTEHNANDDDVEGDVLAVVEPLYDVTTGFSDHSEDQQRDHNVLREPDLSSGTQKSNASVAKRKDIAKRSEKTEEEALSSVTDLDSRDSSVTATPTLVTKSCALSCKSTQQINISPSQYSKTAVCDTGGITLATQQSHENSLCSIVFPSPVAAMLPPKLSTPRPHTPRQDRGPTSTVSPKASGLRGPAVSRRNEVKVPYEEKVGFDSLLAEEGKAQSFPLNSSTPLATTKYLQARLSAGKAGHIPVQNKDDAACFNQGASVLNNHKDGLEDEHLECPKIHGSQNERDLLPDAHKPIVSELDSLEDSSAPCSSVCITDSLSRTDRQELAIVKWGTDKNTEEKVDQRSKDCHALGDKRQTSINSGAVGIEYIDRKETEVTEDSIVTCIAKSFEIEERKMTDSANKISDVHAVVFEKSQNPEHQNFNTDLQDWRNKGGGLEMVSVIPQSPLQEIMNSFSSESTDPSQSILRPPQTMGTKPGGMSACRIKENSANSQVGDNATTPRLNNNIADKQLSHLRVDRQKSCDDKEPTVIEYKLHGSDSETTERKKMSSENCSKDGSPHSLLETRPLKETSNSLSTAVQASDVDEMSLVLSAYNRKRKLSEADSLDQTLALGQRLVRKILESPLTSQSEKTIHSAPSQVTKISSGSNDEDTLLIIRRPSKRKCFSLEGSPLTSKTPLATRRYKSRHARRALSKSFCLDYEHDEINVVKPGAKEKNSVSQTEDENNILMGLNLKTCAADSDMKMPEENVAECSEKSVNMCSASLNSTLEFVIGKAVESTSVLSGQCKDALPNSDKRPILTGEESITIKTTEKKDNNGAEKEDHSLSCTNEKPKCRRRTKRGLATVENAITVVSGFKSPVANQSETNSDCAAYRSPVEKTEEPATASKKYNSLNSLSYVDNLLVKDDEESLCSNDKIVKASCDPSVNTEHHVNDLQNSVSGEEASLNTENNATIPPADFDLGYSNLDGEMLDLNYKRTYDEENAKISGDSFTPGSQRYKGDQERSFLGVQQTQTEKSVDETFTLTVERKCPVTAGSYEESDDDEEVLCVKKRKHFAVLSDSDSHSSDEYSDEEELSCQLSSSAVSSQSEILTTQQQQALEADLEQLRQNIAREEAKLHMLQHDDTLAPDVRTQSLKSLSNGQRLLKSCAPLQDASLQSEAVKELKESEDEKEDENVVDRNSVWEPVLSPQPHASLCEQSNEIVDINNDESNELFPSPLSPSPPPIVRPSLARKDTAILSRSIFDMDVSEVRSLTKMTKFRQVLEFTSDRAVDISLRKSGEDMYADIQDSQDSEVLVTKASRITPESQASTPPRAETLKCQHSSPSSQKALPSLQTGQTVQFLPRSPSPVEMLPLPSDIHSQDKKKDPTTVKMADSHCSVQSQEGSECDELERDENSSSSSDDGLSDSKEENEGEDVVHHCRSFENEPRWKRKKMGFVASGLTPEKLDLLQKLAENYECKVYAKFNDCVTHVIMKAQDDPAIRVCERTLKYFQGVAGRCWVLSFAWVQDCLNKGYLLPETDYEIEGDTVKGEDHFGSKISRLATKPLLKGFAFACVGASPDMTKKEMRQLLQMSGAEVVEDPWYLAKHPAKDKLVLRCIDSEAQPVTPAETELFNGQYKHNKVVTVKREWLLDSIGTQQLQPLRFYICITGKNLKLPF